MTPGTSQRALVRASRATLRIERARAWLAGRAPGEEVLVVAATRDAASDLLRNAATMRGAAFGWHRATLAQLAAQLATPALAERGLAPLGALAAEALSARVLHGLRARGGLGRFEAAADGPGLARAISRTLAELRMARVSRDALAATSPDLVPLADAFEAELTHAGLADRAEIFRIATALARDTELRSPLVGLPTLLLDVVIESTAERDFVAALAARAAELLATVPAGDDATAAALAAALGASIEELEAPVDATSLTRLQTNLFGGAATHATDPDESVVVLSAPGESRECVEIARRCLQLAGQGVRFDRIAVLLRSPDEYRAHLSEAFARAGVPAHFARGTVRPDPSGRAFLALVACAAERLSATRFAEYLSLGEVPDADAAGEPPAARPAGDRWVAPDEELVQEAIADARGEARRADAEPDGTCVEDPDAQPVAGGVLRAPRRWEQLLVDAAVIGGRERWERRLSGLAHQLASQLADAELEDDAGVAALRLRRTLADLEALRGFALPLVGVLDALPAQASWHTWTAALASLATRALRRPERVLAVLAELAPMGAVDAAVPIDEVRRVLSHRLLEVSVPPPKSRYGRVFVAPAESARGMAFDVVFVPGLAERLFPRKIAEEPILLDAARERLDVGLATNTQRVANERRALRLAVGAACERVVLSYPRLDLDEARPRVPSFYALEALRAAEGRLPGFDELAKRAETLTRARVGWPAPRAPEDAIDAAEHDLAVLDALLRDPEPRPGTARYLLDANPHLGRALRFRGRRWWKRWTWADGLVAAPEPGREAAAARGLEAIRDHALAARSFSPTALQHFAACPYRFFLQAVHRLAPREIPEAIEELDPLERGSLVHEVQFELFQRLEAEALLPVRPAHIERARVLLDDVLDAAAARARDRLAPAIARVWEDGIESIRADLREWLRRAAEDESGFVPWRFELSFGLPGRSQADPHSTPDPVSLDCGIQLRGSIDLVERRADGALRATDHKTGRDRVGRDAITEGGLALQPVFYALALEKRFAGSLVTAGRLYYCTATGGFEERVVPLDAEARSAARVVAEALDAALSKPFLPAAPAKGACTYCDYRVVCGPYEELRSARKPAAELAALARVRALR